MRAEAVFDGFHLHLVEVEVCECQQGDAVFNQAETPVLHAVLPLVVVVDRGGRRLWYVALHLIRLQERSLHAGAVGEGEAHGLVPERAAILHPPVRQRLHVAC